MSTPGNHAERLDNYLKEALYYYDLPGLSAGVRGRGGFDYTAAFGFSNFPEKKPLTTNHYFHMGSVTKLFTGISVLKLVSEGKLSLDDKLASRLPWFSVTANSSTGDTFRKITLRHLLSHTSGLDDVKDYRWDQPETDEGALKRYCMSQEVAGSSLLWEPGEGGFRYSNMAYELLGALVAEVSGTNFEEYVRQNFLSPLQMDHSTLLTFERSPYGSLDLGSLEAACVAMPHSKDADKHIVLEKHFPYNRAHGPSSTLTTNLEDIKKWADAWIFQSPVIQGALGSEDPWKPLSMVPNNGEAIGLSWFIRQQNGYTLYGHEGTDDGFRASFWICPELQLSITVCSNLTGAPVKKINKQIFDILTEI